MRQGPHIDGVVASPTVEIDDTIIMQNGRVVQSLLTQELIVALPV